MRPPVRLLLFLTDAPHFGGAERYAIDMARAAQWRGILSRIGWLRPAGAVNDVFAAAAEGMDVVEVPSDGTFRPLATFKVVRRLLAAGRADGVIVNACGRPGFWAATWAARREGIPSVWVQHMVDGQDYRRMTPRWYGGRVEGPHLWRLPQALRHRLASAGASAVVALNGRDRELIASGQGVSPRRIATIPNGVDCERYRFDPAARERLRRTWSAGWDRPEPPFIVGTAGRLVEGKGMDLLVDAAALAHERGVPILVTIAGEGVRRAALEHQARERGIARAVRFIDFVEDMPAFYSGLDVFVLASRTESFGLVLAEAMACERPVIATPTAGARLQISHDGVGRLLDGFRPEELAAALGELWHASTAAEAMGRRARAHVAEFFSIDLTLQRTLAVLRLAGGGSSRVFDEGRLVAPLMAGEEAA